MRGQKELVRPRDAAADDHQPVEQCGRQRHGVAGNLAHPPECLESRRPVAWGAAFGNLVDDLRLGRIVETQPGLLGVDAPHGSDGGALLGIDVLSVACAASPRSHRPPSCRR